MDETAAVAIVAAILMRCPIDARPNPALAEPDYAAIAKEAWRLYEAVRLEGSERSDF